ncbi:tetratricopeptide repeat protein [Marinifilum fragile]|uniref:tetratricopeptide repeat protein n=1 Tax=Marinifilum fragile TaxID=570161 RepID=UPI002AA703D2|nr:tetratricopeptide repeat protein [Marinifilum fragile]
MNKEIKKQARELYSTKEYNLALTTIFKLDSVETESFLIKESAENQWFQNFEFCNCIAKEDNLVKELLSFSRIDELLYKHFQCDWQDSHPTNPKPFQLKIAEQSPELFVRMLRVSQAFLKNSWYTELNIDQYSEYIKIHHLVWKHLSDQESKLWSEVLYQLDKCININDASSILASIVLIIEMEYSKKPSNAQLQFLSQIYNTFISVLLARLPKNHKFNNAIKQDLKKIIDTQKVNPNVLSLYKCIASWQGFINSHIDPYCYDLKIEPDNENGIITYNRSSKDYYKWELDGLRYEINRIDYLSVAYEEIGKNLNHRFNHSTEIPEFADYEFNCQANYLSLQHFLDDLKLSKFPGGNNLDSQRFYQPLIAASNYYKMLYDFFDQVYQKNKNWFAAYQQLKNDNPNLYEMENFPFIHSSIDELYKIHDGQSKLEKDFKTKITTLSSPYTYKAKIGNDFDRFNIHYDVFKKPFLQLGKYVFTPTLFFAKQDWFYSTTQNALERLSNKRNDKQRKETSVEMESDLKLLFGDAGFDAEIFYGHEFSNSEGDIDIKVTGGKDTILIQLKRTKLRLNLKDSYFEYLQTDNKASRQINNVEKHFSSPKGKIYKWIVTTSFENTYTTINDCLKVNYFDLITILKSFTYLKDFSIQDLVNRITSDSQISDVLQYKAVLHPENLDLISFKQYSESGIFKNLLPLRNQFEIYDAVTLPLPMAEPQAYREAKFHTDKSSSNYIGTYNKALNADRNGNYSKAKSLFEICLNQYPNDFDALSAQANVLANMKLFDQALSYFEKALKIYPEDLFVCRNYALALMEAGKEVKAFKIYTQIKKEYPFVDIQFLQPIKNLPPEIIEKMFSK